MFPKLLGIFKQAAGMHSGLKMRNPMKIYIDHLAHRCSARDIPLYAPEHDFNNIDVREY